MNRLLLTAVNCALALFAPAAMSAGLGELDEKFGTNGLSEAGFDLGGMNWDTQQVQVPGKGGATFLVGTASAHGYWDKDAIAIAKIQHDGQLDLSYGDGGRKLFTLPSSNRVLTDFNVSAALTPDGKLIVAATVKFTKLNVSRDEGLLCKFDQFGNLTSGFGAVGTELEGCTSIRSADHPDDDLSPGVIPYARLGDIAVGADGSIYVGGRFSYTNVDRAAIGKFTPDGALDETFGHKGFFSANVSDMTITDVELTPDGGVLGFLERFHMDNAPSRIFLVKANASTGLEWAGFGENNSIVEIKTKLSDAFDKHGRGLEVLRDGTIYVGAEAYDSEEVIVHPFIMRLTKFGVANQLFGEGGVVYVPSGDGVGMIISEIDATANRVAFAGAWFGAPEFLEWGVMAFDGTGKPEAGFGTLGSTKIYVPYSYARSIDGQGNRLVVAGDDGDFMVARLDHGKTAVYNVSVAATANGSVVPAVSQLVPDSDIAEFKIVPKFGYRIANVTGCPDGELIKNRYRTGPVTFPCSVKATFEKIPINLP